jgi:hypothetical protein
MDERLVEAIMVALGEQTVTVPDTAAAARTGNASSNAR